MKKRILSCCIVTALLLCCLALCALPAAAVGDVIDFTRDSFNLYPNQSYQLTMKNNAAVTSYTSSDPGIVSVNHTGMVKALSAGSSIVTASDDEGHTATCTVTVREGTAPQRVVLETQTISMTEGESVTLNATVEPADVNDNRLYYTSSDDAVVRVDKSGHLKAVKAGDAVITVESASAAVSSKCMVKVSSKAGRNFSVSLTGTLYSMAGEQKSNMRVEIMNADESFETTTDKNGRFYFDDIIKGTYTLRVYKNSKSTVPTAAGQLSVGSHDMILSCIINDKELVVLYQNEEEGTAEVQDIVLEKNALTLEVGESYDMVFRVRPSDAALPTMKSTTDNAQVATADMDGHITALAEGTATITFSANNSNITRSCKVTVIAPTSTAHSLTIIIVEGSIFLLIVIVFLIAYRRFIRKKERAEGIVNPKHGRRAKE